MTTLSGTYKLGPDSGHIHLRTTREGMAAKVGHDLLIDLPAWSGVFTADAADPATATLEVDRHPKATFSAKGIPADSELEGTLALHGATHPLRLSFTESGSSNWRAKGEVVQSDFGIKPFKGLLGALRLADRVTVDIEIRLDGAV
jgi:polyisoprenoid-binding protein YceI